MAERVSVRDGILPIIVVAPHGPDDPRTDIIAETIAARIDCHAVINNGWERATSVDVANDKANCNSISHCHEDVVKDEFLDPILRYAYRSSRTIAAARNISISQFLYTPLLITIHGAGDNARNLAKSTKLDFIFGNGNGSPNRHSCSIWRKNALVWALVNKGINVWEGKGGGTYAAWGKDNLNQLFFGKYPGVGESLQIEIVRVPWRVDDKRAVATGCILADAIKEVLKIKDFSPFNGDLGLPSC